jgi:hypothetical protein
VQAVKRRALARTEGFLADGAFEALLFLRMHTHLAFAGLPAGGTGGVRTKCGFRGEGCNRFWFHTQVVLRTPDYFKKLLLHGYLWSYLRESHRVELQESGQTLAKPGEN